MPHSKPTRRRFLQKASAMAAAPYVITSAALGNEDRPAASERITIGYLGTGPRGRLNVREQLTCPDAQVVAVCDVWQHVRNAAKQMVDGHYGNSDCKA
ncbi:hypothetical protein LCGC14_2178030, partial [marine sediment metagenome]